MIIELTKKEDKYYLDIIKPWENRGCGDIFTASNGWELRSAFNPIINTMLKTFHVNGILEAWDGGISYHLKCHNFPCEIDKETYVNIKLLLTEYKASLEL